MENHDLVVGHPFLSNDDLLSPIDNEVSSPIVFAVLTTMNSVILSHAVEAATLRSEHHWNLSDHDVIKHPLLQDFLNLWSVLPGLLVNLEFIFGQFILRQLNVHEQLSCIGQVTDAGFMGEHCTLRAVLFTDSGA
jgi:hypothetical protein